MARISEYSKLTAQIEKIQEKIKFKNELLELDVRLIKEATASKIAKFVDKENSKLYEVRFSLSNIDEEVNKRLPNAMRKYNIKDYWLRREAIQTYRVAGYSSEAKEALDKRIQELNQLKFDKERQVKEKIYSRLNQYILVDEKAKAEQEHNLEGLIKESLVRIEENTKKCYEIQENKINSLKEKNKKFNEKANDKLKELLEKRAQEKNEEYTLEKGIVLEVNNLTMQFGGLKAVDNLSFKVKEGEIFGLIGPNGAGKTTVFNCITRFYDATDGEMYFENKYGEVVDLRQFKVHDIILQGIGRTFQNIELVKEVSVIENLLVASTRSYKTGFFGHLLGFPSLKKEEKLLRAKAMRILKFMGLENYAQWYAMGLPYGILKKVEIARALMADAKLIIMDEPAAGLNDRETAELTETIRKIRDEFGVTILLVEHDMGLVMSVCDTVCAISFGQMLAIGTTEEIQKDKAVQEAYLGASEEE